MPLSPGFAWVASTPGLVSVVAIVLPLLCLVLVASTCLIIFRRAHRFAFGRRAAS